MKSNNICLVLLVFLVLGCGTESKNVESQRNPNAVLDITGDENLTVSLVPSKTTSSTFYSSMTVRSLERNGENLYSGTEVYFLYNNNEANKTIDKVTITLFVHKTNLENSTHSISKYRVEEGSIPSIPYIEYNSATVQIQKDTSIKEYHANTGTILASTNDAGSLSISFNISLDLVENESSNSNQMVITDNVLSIEGSVDLEGLD